MRIRRESLTSSSADVTAAVSGSEQVVDMSDVLYVQGTGVSVGQTRKKAMF